MAELPKNIFFAQVGLFYAQSTDEQQEAMVLNNLSF
jgi:hypothetical protein